MRRRSYLSRRAYVGCRVRVELVREGWDNYTPIRISHPSDVYRFMRHARHSDRESLYSLLLDSRNQLVGCEEVSRGSLNTTRASPREIYKSALLANAMATLLAHNHPSGDPEPSAEDIEFTKAVARAGEVLGIELYDHVIVGHHHYTSLRERGLL